MVRKILIMIMTIAVTVSPITVFASDNAEGEMPAAEESSGVDINALSDVQITALLQEVNQEIMNRGEITVTRADENDEFLWKNAPIEEDFQYQFELKKGDILEVRRAGTLTMVAGGVKFQ